MPLTPRLRVDRQPELIPEHIADKFKQLQAEWYKVTNSTSAAEFKARVLKNATHPKTLLVDHCPGFNCVAK